jgi:hypothetical protein
MPKRDRGASLTDLLAEATGDTPEAKASTTKAPEVTADRSPEAKRTEKRGRGEAWSEPPPTGHVRASDGSYVRADGAKRVSLQLKMDPDDKRALKVQAAAEGLSPAEYVARLVREDGRR